MGCMCFGDKACFSDKNKIFLLVGLVIFLASAQSVTIPIVSNHYESIYFVLLMVCVQFTVISFFTMLWFNRKVVLPSKKDCKTIFWCGLYNALMTIFYPYSADPDRTQPIMQTILMGLKIIPSVFFTKCILHKENTYSKKYIAGSMFFLTGSLVLTLIPLQSNFNVMSLLWIGIFIAGMLFATLYSIYQEKYIMDTGDRSTANKMVLIFWARLIQTIIIASCYWVEYILGYGDDPSKLFRESADRFATNLTDAMLLEAGILAYLLMYIAATYLNAISTNYNMIASAGVQPVVALFFTIFSELNTGVQYPWYITLPAISCSLLSIYLWMKGERIKTSIIDDELSVSRNNEISRSVSRQTQYSELSGSLFDNV